MISTFIFAAVVATAGFAASRFEARQEAALVAAVNEKR